MTIKQPWRLVIEILACFISLEALRIVLMFIIDIVPQLFDYLKATEVDRFNGIASYADAVYLAPLFETLAIAILVGVFFKVTDKLVLICTSVASLAGAAHLHAGLLTASSAIVSFYVLTFFYIRWLKLAGRAKGFIAALVPHMLTNSLAVAVIVLDAG